MTTGRKLSWALATAGLVLAVSACGDGSPPARTRPVFPSDSPIEVNVGVEFEIVVYSNPTTGYHWRIVKAPDPAVATHVGSDYVGHPNPEHKVGVGGTEYWIFKAVAPGETAVGLEYSRGEGAEPAESPTVTIRVR